MSARMVRYEKHGDVAVMTFDDGKANVLSPTSLAALGEALERAESEARCLLWLGRPGRFCAGFDLSVMNQGGEAVTDLVRSGAELAIRVYASPIPVLMGVTGHALAMGAILLMAADRRLAAEGEFKIGLNEVAIGMTLPKFGIEFARERLSPLHLGRSVANSELYSPATATQVGYIDRVVPASEFADAAMKEAHTLASLDPRAHKTTKHSLRKDALARIRGALSELGA
ncbi:MAG: crotonase/enoyl-CoA hydratase family protein [Myxococcota bacterium]